MDNVVVAVFTMVCVVDAEILRSPPTAKDTARPVGVFVATPTELVVVNVPTTVEDALETNPPVPLLVPFTLEESPNVESPVTLNAAPAVEEAVVISPPDNVVRPVTLKAAPAVEEAVARNPPSNVPRPVIVVAPVNVDAPETVRVPPVVILVLMVVAAYPTNATAITATTTEKNTEIYFRINMNLVNLILLIIKISNQ